LIGPIAKISDEDLPRRPNIVYAGKRSYGQLPAYLAGFDAAILPFARNEATRFISPTKTLEYLAARKPIVSTPIRDVMDLYGEVVEFGSDAQEFIAAIERLWAEPVAARERRAAASRRLLRQYDWDVIADSMLALIRERSSARAGGLAGLATYSGFESIADLGFAQAGASD
jgi:UDP-galactopyranose mutase